MHKKYQVYSLPAIPSVYPHVIQLRKKVNRNIWGMVDKHW